MTEVKEDSWDSSQSDKLKRKLNSEEVVKSKRLFGMIKGTLNSLKEKTPGEIKRQEVQEKLLNKLNKEKKEMQEKLDQEIEEKKLKLTISRKNEDEKRLEKLQEFLGFYYKKLENFDLTVTEPRIYFKPKIQSKISTEKLTLTDSFKTLLKEYMDKEYPNV